MSFSYKHNARINAYENGLRRCPCCNVQLVWKSYQPVVQKNMATVDHIVPKSIGGGNTVDNMYVMCRQCNNDRDTMCFVEFLVSRGISKTEAEALYKKAHIASVKVILFNLINQANDMTTRKRLKKYLKQVVQNYRRYFNDYLPEFDLLPKEFCN